MRSHLRMAALVLSVAAALITVWPVTSRAADIPVASRLHPLPGGAATECPLTEPSGPAGCAASDPDLPASSSDARRPGQGGRQTVSQANDASGDLLEELVSKAPGRWESVVTP